MSKDKRWFCMALGVLLLAFAVVGLANYVLDPYGLFRKDFSWQFVEPDKDFIKTRYVTENPDRFDCFVFGSSRVNSIDVRKIKDATCYNMHSPVALPRNYLDDMRYLLKKRVRMKLVLIGLDDFSFKLDPNAQLSQPLTHPYPPVLGHASFPYYLKYLFSLHDIKILTAIYDGYLKRAKGPTEAALAYRDLFTTGQIYSSDADESIEGDPEKHMNNPVFTERHESSGDNMAGAVDDLRALVQIARVHQVRLVFFINPLYRYAYLDSGLDEFDSFKKGLSRITEFYDFSGLNSVTTNSYYYYDNAHYRRKLGDMIIARIFGDKRAEVPADFGVLVTAENIDRHLASLRQQVEKEVGR
jgi:hypothetical protein